MTTRNIFIPVISFVFLSILIGWYIIQNNQKSNMELNKNSKDEISYIAIGDSYTIGLGVSADHRWPNILTGNLRQAGIKINLITNPSVSGYTVRDAIELELPVVEKLKPDFVTVLIGANDNFGQEDVGLFGKELEELLNKLQSILTNSKNIVLITIPDYSKSPSLKGYQTRDVSILIKEYNQVIKNEASKRGLTVADIFPISQTMTSDEDYISDGLHPSAKGYAKWEKVIFPVVFKLLKR